ncbi:MAG TPA: hypothetical protein VE987_04585 [Polyangiaceae bacterium]|nr:hypothetical protein [Polyangiaceae bacterium]
MSTGGPKGRSTRLAIVEQSLTDTLERLRELPAGPRVRELRAKAEGYERALRAWMVRPPSEEQRAALLKLVLELNVEVMALGRADKKET